VAKTDIKIMENVVNENCMGGVGGKRA